MTRLALILTSLALGPACVIDTVPLPEGRSEELPSEDHVAGAGDPAGGDEKGDGAGDLIPGDGD